jgi:hypothetical protein
MARTATINQQDLLFKLIACSLLGAARRSISMGAFTAPCIPIDLTFHAQGTSLAPTVNASVLKFA